MIRVLALMVLILPLTSQAQFTYILDNSIPVGDLQGNNLSLPWAGGLNAAQFNTMDLNGDGVDDLVLFDRMADKVITFITVENQYIAAPEYENFFPLEISNWLLLRDYNCDGKKDIFTSDVLGIKLYTNTTPSGGGLAWEQYLFNTGHSGSKSTVLLTEGSSTKVNLQLQFDDLPSISDLDGDGDLDILNIQYAGHTVEFHQNLSMENNLPCDSLEFKRMTRSWGDFRECHCGDFAFSGMDCPPASGGRTEHAGGKALLTLDLSGDGVQDLLFSEATCNQLFALRNEGTSVNAVMNAFSPFPASDPVNLVIYPAAYYEDVDFDGKKDLIASPAIFNKEFLNINLQESTWFYRNTGTTENPVFTLVERDFLQGSMIDVGDNAIPAFADFDGDGDLDMFISSHFATHFRSAIYLYENTGSASSPAFALLNDNYLEFSATPFYNVKIQFADFNSDQKPDLVFTATSLETRLTHAYYLPNKSMTTLDFSGSSLQRLDFHLTNTENIHATDVNGDGLPDILAGRSEGNLEYWRNSGIKGSPSFVLEEENFLALAASPFRQNVACATGDLNADGKPDLLMGDQSGSLAIVSDYRKGAGEGESPAERNILFNPIEKIYAEKNLGGRVWPTLVNLFHSDKPAIVVGNILGGVHLLKHDAGKSLPDNPEVNVYPNPVAKDELLHVKTDRGGIMQVISVLGQHVSPAVVLKGNQVYQYALPPLSSGLYFLKFTADKKSHTERFIVE